MFRQRRYFCQSITFYQREQYLSKVMKDCEDCFKQLDQHGKSIKRETKDMFIKFTQGKLQEQKKLLETDSVGVFSMVLDIIENLIHDKPLMSYILTTIEAIISDNQRLFKQFMRALTPQVLPKLKQFLFLDGYDPMAYEAAAKIATMIIAEEGGNDAKEWVILFLGGIGNKLKIADFMIMPICVHFLKHEALAIQFIKSGGIRIISNLLSKYSTDLQIAYYTILALWLLSFTTESIPLFSDPTVGLIRLIIESVQKISREKILRVSFACFRNLVDVSPQSIELMVDNGLIKVVDLLLKGNLKDQDLIDDIKYVGEILEKNMKILTSFEKYVKELNAQNLTWSPVHTEKFWKENVKKFEENDFLLIRKLAEILKSNNNQNVAVACYDLGEFCRFHPFGKVVLEQLNAKQEIMRQARNDDQQIREHALLSLQKIMLHNWQV
ncbi:unnamed protein product (macronuclear) [Paramecium tetraurelia]|uniref:V-type proton ATPase subunit H n=1 Tax=Paramecium tetraurelia TaxID=5888 RepID=A0BYU7_PARTE|nr:uncharacterized protein GSPATT00033567001 [Paramecium tetraurelia]CAK63714.1 unnamed protein product [Paramecium tetraurelia]|eukprot:XP_001431112.1 hypothetical protein (macronuclear) [Paramecium tetraurelia strain d4-2]